MSASISAPSSPVAAITQLAADVAGPLDAASGNAGDAGPFAALFLQALGKQIAENLDPQLLSLGKQITENLDPELLNLAKGALTEELGEDASDELNALLPFLEAMGIVPAAPVAGAPLTTPASVVTDVATDVAASSGTAGTLNGEPASTSAKSAVELLLDKALAEMGGALRANGLSASASPGNVQNEGQALPTSLASATETSPNAALLAPVKADTEFATQLKSALETASGPVNTTTYQTGNTAAHALASSAPLTPASPSAPTTQFQVMQPVGAGGWSEEIGNHVVWMSNRMESRAELVLTPPQMGRVEVSLSVSGDQASATFVSANAAVREALESALPRLREVLAEAGIQLGQAQVGAENPRQTAQQDNNGDNFAFARGNAADAPAPQETLNSAALADALKVGRGLVDVFA